MIDLTDHTGLFKKLISKNGLPWEEYDDLFQEFAVYFYKREGEYNDKYGVSTFIFMMFGNWLSDRAVTYNTLKRQGQDEGISIESQHPHYLDYVQTQNDEEVHFLNDAEKSVYLEELIEGASETLQGVLLERAGGVKGRGDKGKSSPSFIRETAVERGVSVETVSKGVRRELRDIRNK